MGTENRTYEYAVCDLNGVMRGKRFPPSMLPKILSGGARMPASVLACDIWGEDYASNEFLAKTGDGDIFCIPTGRPPLHVDWLAVPACLVPMWLANDDGSPFAGDPRCELELMCRRYKELEFKPVTALELEFYLVDVIAGRPSPIRSPVSRQRMDRDRILSLDDIEHLEAFFDDIYSACEKQGIPVDAASSENGPGQFEINLHHTDDPLKAADDAVFLKRLVRGVARRHGFAATFMAKPYGNRSGSSMHTHFSLIGAEGGNLFDDGTDSGSEMLGHAVGGVLQSMQDCMLVHAPHLNSYRRPQPNSLAPRQACWGYENRTVAVRIPGGPGTARRLEFRMSGADANPYLVLTALLGAALAGIEAKSEPGPPTSGVSYDGDTPDLDFNWERAIADFARSKTVAGIFSADMIDMFTSCKQYEADRFRRSISGFEYDTYLETA
ncbi:MAG: glutamine synthetase family protein [Rhodobacteraceae bacterium]|nr:glutamine synthetase family protein [Paracoccaceae bacterium]